MSSARPDSSDHTKRLRELALHWIDCGWRRPRRDAFIATHAPDFGDRSAVGRAADREGFWSGVMQLYTSFPDFEAVADDLVVDAARGTVAIRWSAFGTHRGEFAGIAPTGRRVRFTGIEIIQVYNDRIQQRWGEWNAAEIMEQLAAPPREPA